MEYPTLFGFIYFEKMGMGMGMGMGLRDVADIIKEIKRKKKSKEKRNNINK